MEVKLIHVTPDAEKHIAYCARVSSNNQNNPEYEKLIKYLIEHKHWSPFEMVNMCIEVVCSRVISAQILRHRSMSFQEYSSRYAKSEKREIVEARRQDLKNRQNSIDDMSDIDKAWFRVAQDRVWDLSYFLYKEALDKGIAKEVARNLLPLATQTKIEINGNIRSWIHYIELRTHKDTQLEHRLIAEECKNIFIKEFPIISKGLGWV